MPNGTSNVLHCCVGPTKLRSVCPSHFRQNPMGGVRDPVINVNTSVVFVDVLRFGFLKLNINVGFWIKLGLEIIKFK